MGHHGVKARWQSLGARLLTGDGLQSWGGVWGLVWQGLASWSPAWRFPPLSVFLGCGSAFQCNAKWAESLLSIYFRPCTELNSRMECCRESEEWNLIKRLKAASSFAFLTYTCYGAKVKFNPRSMKKFFVKFKKCNYKFRHLFCSIYIALVSSPHLVFSHSWFSA